MIDWLIYFWLITIWENYQEPYGFIENYKRSNI